MGALKGFFYHVFSYYLYDIFGTNVEICRQNMPSLVLYMANRATRHDTDTGTMQHYTMAARQRHDVLPCRAISGYRV